MRAGGLRHWVIIERPVESKGAMGGTQTQWTVFHQCYADVKELSGREMVQSEQVASKIVATAYMRYVANINATMRLVHEDKIYQIESVINKDGKKIMQELTLYEFR